MSIHEVRTRLLSDLPEHCHFVLGKTNVHEWMLDVSTGALRFATDPGIFHGIKDIATFLAVVHPDDREAVERITQSMLLKAERCYYECRLVLGPNDVHWIAVNGGSQTKGTRVERLYGLTQDITERKRAEAVAQGQRRALEQAMSGAPLGEILDLLCHLAEEQAGDRVVATILMLDDDGRLKLGAAPSLPESFHQAIGELVPGYESGSYGAAALLARPVIVTDILADESWRPYRNIALAHDLKACWSIPLLASNGALQATMALYCEEKRGPSDWEFDSMTLLANTASLIIERYTQTQERNRAELRFRSLVGATNAIVWTTSPQVEVFRPLPEWGAFTGFTTEQMRGLGWVEAIHPDDREILHKLVMRMRGEAAPLQTELRLRRADGVYREMVLHAVPIVDSSGAVKEWAGSYTDITERKESEERLRYQATHDALTELPNRAFLNEHLQQLLEFTTPSESVAVMLIDLDRFKHINDSMGHDSGDELLRLIAQRLRSALPEGDLVVRLGGDEFVVIAHARDGRHSARALAKVLVEVLAEPLVIDGSQLVTGASIGVCLYPEHGLRKDVLIQNADIAMYRAKAEGGNRYRFFSEEMSVALKQRMGLEIALRGALERGEFVLHYQPRACLPSGGIRGVEALLRWNHPERGLVPPMEFIPIAEEIGLINEIGIWVLRQACEDIQALNGRLGMQLQLSVNVSPTQLSCPCLLQQVRDALTLSGFVPGHLELELTEGAFIHDLDASTLVMCELKALGVRLAVDDFGTGHAGIEYLRRFPIDTFKLDRTFIAPISQHAHEFEFMKALTDMAHALGLHVVAEGVEDRETWDLLCQTHCDEAQGYLFARPLPLSQLEGFIAGNHKPRRDDSEPE